MVFDRALAEAEFARRLLPIARRWRRAGDSALMELGLSEANGWVLINIGRLGDKVRQGVLVEALDISGASLVRLLDQLERLGLVSRVMDNTDRRANRVALTESGQAVVTKIEEALAAIRNDLLGGVTDEELESANAVLNIVDQRVSRRRSRLS